LRLWSFKLKEKAYLKNLDDSDAIMSFPRNIWNLCTRLAVNHYSIRGLEWLKVKPQKKAPKSVKRCLFGLESFSL
jgi:hypothetical protein